MMCESKVSTDKVITDRADRNSRRGRAHSYWPSSYVYHLAAGGGLQE